MFGPKGPFCQSCGMPLSKDNGKRESEEYCSKCFQNGKFTDPNITLEEMKIKVKGKMNEMHIPGFLASFFMKDMNKLKRWAK